MEEKGDRGGERSGSRVQVMRVNPGAAKVGEYRLNVVFKGVWGKGRCGADSAEGVDSAEVCRLGWCQWAGGGVEEVLTR